MWFVVVGLVGLILHFAGIGPLGALVFKDAWWMLVSPFALALAWWYWSDATGRTQRQAMRKVDAKRQERRERQLSALGQPGREKR